MFIDTHAHLIWEKLAGREPEVIQAAKDAGVEKIITVGCDIETTQKSLECAEQFEEVFFTAGIHPSDAHKVVDWEKFESFISHPKCVSVGECGFDFYYADDTRDQQKKSFEKQLQLAEKYNKPVVIHTRDAGVKTLEVLKKYQPKKFVIHCFTETKEFADEVVKMGGLFSVGGILTYPNAKDLREAVSTIPLENLMLETDCPYLAPQSVRGKINEPKYIPEIAAKLAEIQDLSVEKVEQVTTQTAQDFFGLL